MNCRVNGETQWQVWGKPYLLGKVTSSLGNVYLPKQYINMPENMKWLVRNQFQVSEIPGMWTKFPGTIWKFQVNDGGHIIGKHKKKKPWWRQTVIPSALSIRIFIRQKYDKYVTHFAEKSTQIQINSDKFKSYTIHLADKFVPTELQT